MGSVTPSLVNWYLKRSLRKPWHRPASKKCIELYCEPQDPYSDLCHQVAQQLQPILSIPIHINIVSAPPPHLYPEPDKQRTYASIDCARIAPAWGLRFQDQGYQPTAEYDDHQLEHNNTQRMERGHYLPAMWSYGGKWFWGLDRLTILLEELVTDGKLATNYQDTIAFDASKASLPLQPIRHPLDYYFSFRSPYSYLSVKPVLALFKQDIEINVKPVLPMVMRGLPVPKEKRLYIARDATRLAHAQGQPFGKIADPVGQGAENALKIFAACKTAKQQLAWLSAASTAAFAKGKPLSNRKTLKALCMQVGINWEDAEQCLRDDDGLAYAEKNRQEMFSLGLWGVPSFKYGELTVWGQDRLWMIEEAIRRSVDSSQN